MGKNLGIPNLVHRVTIEAV